MKAYLLGYNAVCGAAWLFCAVRCACIFLGGASAGEAYAEIGMVLVAAQTAMLLEIVHSLLGLVPSPVVVVMMQVGSRIFIVWGHLYWVKECQQHSSLFLMVLSWSVTEVVRYAFYFCNLLGGVPFPLFYLRYSLFMVLYPTGISGEILQTLIGMGAYWKVANPLWYRLSLIMLIFYMPCSPFMIANMWANRKRSFKKRFASKEEPQGVQWPRTKAGDRSSTSTNRSILAAAGAAGPGGEEAATKISKEKKWRFAYSKHLLDHVKQSLQSEDGCLAMARAGLDAAHGAFTFVRQGHGEMPVRDVMDKLGEASSAAFETAELCGEKSPPTATDRQVVLYYGGPTFGKPYYRYSNTRKTPVSGMKLRELIDAWAEYGTIEADTAEALKTLQLNQSEWLDLSDMYFVLLGAASAMGPLWLLLSLGANVVAVARPKALKGIIQEARQYPGKLLFPVKKGSDWKELVATNNWDALGKVAGCDLLTQTPEIAAWLATVAPGKSLTVGNYTYLDGALHVQIAVACDCIMQYLCKKRASTAVAFLGTATDATLIPADAADAMDKAHAVAPWWAGLWEALGVLQRNRPLACGDLRLLDSVLTDQGPNYILAKRLQHWRAMVARADGHVASSNVSPSTATSSVTSNASFAAAYGGMHIFAPMEVVFQELSMSLMAALLIHDVRNSASAAQPATKLQHPLCLFRATSCHGGSWRCPYSIKSMGIPSAVTYYMTVFWPYILATLMALGSLVYYAVTGRLPEPIQSMSFVPLQQLSTVVAKLAATLGVPL